MAGIDRCLYAPQLHSGDDLAHDGIPNYRNNESDWAGTPLTHWSRRPKVALWVCRIEPQKYLTIPKPKVPVVIPEILRYIPPLT